MNDPAEIAAKLLEDEESEDPKEFLMRHAEADPHFLNQAVRISGDVNAWEYGGSWLLPATKEIVHIRGLEGEGINEKDGWDFEVPEDVVENIIRERGGDPDLPIDEQENEREIENAIDAWKQEEADKHNEAIEMPVYRWSVEPLDSWVDVEELKQSLGEEQWNEVTLADQNIMAAEYYGLENFDSYPDNYTRAELSKYLSVKL